MKIVSILRSVCLALILGIIALHLAGCEAVQNAQWTACYEEACLTYDPRDVHRPEPPQDLRLPQRMPVKGSGK